MCQDSTGKIKLMRRSFLLSNHYLSDEAFANARSPDRGGDFGRKESLGDTKPVLSAVYCHAAGIS